MGLVEQLEARVRRVEIGAQAHILNRDIGEPPARLLEFAVCAREPILQMTDEITQVARGKLRQFDLRLLVRHLTVGHDIARGDARHRGSTGEHHAQT